MNSAVIVDIDGTLADCNHRRHHVADGNRNWPAFFAGMAEDPLIQPVAKLVSLIAFSRREDINIILCSGRPEDYRQVTEEWLNRHGVAFDELYMRPAGDTRIDHVVKEELLERIISDGYEPFLVIDDRPSVVAMWRRRGLVCLQADPGQQEIKGRPGQS